MTMHDFDFERYKSLDFSNAKPVRLNPKIRQFQDNLRAKNSQNRQVVRCVPRTKNK